MVLAPGNCTCPFQDPGASVAYSPICGGSFVLFLSILEQFINGRCDISEPCKRIVGTPDSDLYDEYDFIVVGGGSAGSVIAGRLADNGTYKVLLLEAGGQEPVSSRVPSFYRSYYSNPDADWSYRTQPGPYCLEYNGYCQWPRGKVLGGTSVLNGMMYHRGHPADFDDWAAAGAEGWSWEDNLYYYNITENNKQIGTLVSSQYHATGGPLPVQRFRYHPEAADDVLTAVSEVGLQVIADLNDLETPIGFTMPQTFNDDGQRFTTARAYLEPVFNKYQLHVKLNSHVSRVLFNGTQAYGVEYINGNQTRTVRASKEVILAAGALNTPQILMLSGIGPANILSSLNITPISTLPVGQNLRNHIGMTIYYLLTNVTNVQTLNWEEATKYLLERAGPMTATGLTQVSGLEYSSLADQTKQQPDLQFFFNGYYAECSQTGVIGEPVGSNPNAGKNISINAVSLLPKSVGYVTLNSTNPLDPPIFYANYFSHPDDMVMLKDAARIVKNISEAPILTQKYGITLDPNFSDGCNNSQTWSDAWIECMARLRTDPQNHQIGTAAIASVVDNKLNVYNVTGLRVGDASVIPTLMSGNPQGMIMMVAEKCAAFIVDKWSGSS